MIRASLRSITLASLPLLAAGCFEDVGSSDRGDDSTTGAGDGDPSGDGDGDPSGDGDGDPTGDGDGDADPGPQVIDSLPAAGNQDAGLEPYFLLYFDRVVDPDDALGSIQISQAGGPAQPVTVMGCPNLDPTCVAGLFPAQLLTDGRLPPSTEHQIVVTPGLEDLEGNATSVEQTVDYRTFVYDPEFFDDSDTLGEVGGIAFAPASSSLFVVGQAGLFTSGPTIRRINLVEGSPSGVSTALQMQAENGGPETFGLDRYGDRLFMSMTDDGSIRVLTTDDPVVEQAKFSEPSLQPPHDTLREVWSVARSQDGRMFAAYGEFVDGPNGTGIVEVSALNEEWSVFNPGTNLWGANDEVTITVGQIVTDEHLVAFADGKLFKFRTSDGELIDEYETDFNPNERVGLRIDSQGWLWLGGNVSGIRVYDVTGGTLIELARRAGIPCGRMTLREGPGPTNVYCVAFRGAGVITWVPVEL